MSRLFIHCCICSLLAAETAVAETRDLKHPDWHPDGSYLVSEGSCAGSIDLYLIDLDSGSVSQVWDGGFVEGYPRWFSDGQQIAFHQIDDERQSRVLIAELSLSGEIANVVRITSGPFDIEPAPSPDGKSIVYSMQGEMGLDIALLDLGGQNAVRVWKTRAAENFPSWFPDGRSLTFYSRDESGTQIYARDLQSDELVALTWGEGPNFVGSLSPDGKVLAYSSERTGDREIYLRIVANGEEQRITVRTGRDGYVKFSPDGRQLAYHSVIGDGTDEHTVVRVLNLETGGLSEFSCPGGTGDE